MSDIFLSKPAVLCCAGSNIEELWASVKTGNQDGIKRVKALNGKEFWAGRVDDSLLSEKSSARYDMRFCRLEEKCLEQLSAMIEIVKEKYGSEKVGVCVGTCDNGTEFSLAGHKVFFEKGAFAPDYTLEIQSADYAATFISEKYGIKGPSMAFETACSSSAGAIVKASELLRSGICDAVIAGGVDIASDTVLMGFDALEAVSPEKTNPFSKNRHGITLAEGAAFFVMTKERLDNDSIRLLGYGESADAYHMTSPDPSGNGAVRAMMEALKRAGLKPEEIDYVNLHGTGTRFNDSMEAKAIDEIFASYKVPCSTTKSMTGHTLGAAGAIEAAICWVTLIANKNGEKALPLQIWDGVRDEELPEINIVSKENKNTPQKVNVCMSNSFAFGGANTSLLLGL